MIRWRDAQGPANGESWIQTEDLDELISSYDDELITSFGVIVRETEHNWFMASHFHSSCVHSLMAIPKSSVVDMAFLNSYYGRPLENLPPLVREQINACMSP